MSKSNKSERLSRDQRGSVPAILAFMMIPLAGIVGGAIDFGHAVSERTRLNSVLDAAVIVAAKSAQDADDASKSTTEILAAAKKAGLDYFNAARNLPAGTVPILDVTLQDRSVSVTASYSSSVKTTMLNVLGFKTFPVSGKAASALSLSPMVDIHLLIDVSGSMAIGARSEDILKLQAKLGCAFACHDDVKLKDSRGRDTKYDAFEWAQANGILLRINEINNGIVEFVNWLQSQPSAAKRIRIAVYSFANDLTTIVPITPKLSDAVSSLPKAPNVSGETQGATHFKEIMPGFAQIVGKSGDGATTAKKLVIIATDGVQDPNRTWTWNTSLRAQVAPFAPSDCRKLDSSVSVGVLYAPYLDLSPDWGFLATLGQPSQVGGRGRRFDDIVPQLEACASAANMFVNTGASTSVATAFKDIFKTFTTVRLSQ